MRRALIAPALLVALAASLTPARSAVGSVYLVGAAFKDISPIGWGEINLGGFGLGDGTSPISQAIGPGN